MNMKERGMRSHFFQIASFTRVSTSLFHNVLLVNFLSIAAECTISTIQMARKLIPCGQKMANIRLLKAKIKKSIQFHCNKLSYPDMDYMMF